MMWLLPNSFWIFQQTATLELLSASSTPPGRYGPNDGSRGNDMPREHNHGKSRTRQAKKEEFLATNLVKRLHTAYRYNHRPGKPRKANDEWREDRTVNHGRVETRRYPYLRPPRQNESALELLDLVFIPTFDGSYRKIPRSGVKLTV